MLQVSNSQLMLYEKKIGYTGITGKQTQEMTI